MGQRTLLGALMGLCAFTLVGVIGLSVHLAFRRLAASHAVSPVGVGQVPLAGEAGGDARAAENLGPWLSLCRELAECLDSVDEEGARGRRLWSELLQTPLPAGTTMDGVLWPMAQRPERFSALAGWSCSLRRDAAAGPLDVPSALWAEALDLCRVYAARGGLAAEMAANTLARLGGVPAARTLIVDWTETRGGAETTHARERLMRIPQADLLAALRELYRDAGTEEVRGPLVSLLEDLTSEEAGRLLLEFASEEPRPGIRSHCLVSAARMVARINDPQAQRGLIGAIRGEISARYLAPDRRDSDRLLALGALGGVEERWARATLAEWLRSPPAGLGRGMVAAALVQRPTAVDVDVLVPLVEERDPELAFLAANALCQGARLRPDEPRFLDAVARHGVPRLDALLGVPAPSESRRIQIVRTLAQAPGGTAAAVLLGLAAGVERPGRYAEAIEEALVATCGESARGRLEERLSGELTSEGRGILGRVLRRVGGHGG